MADMMRSSWRLMIGGLFAVFLLAMTPTQQAEAADFDPCIPDICDYVERLVEHTKDEFVQSAIDALPNPGHVKQIVDCLDQLMSLAMNIGLILTWPDFSALLTRIIDRLCQQITSKWDAIISQLSAQFQLPEIPITIFGNTYTDWIGGSFEIGVTRGNGVPGGNINLDLVSPIGPESIILR
ncbi:MAG: hypothetical protein KI792_03660 [Alphaproteobacteria bacterium]|nr:hypothetical protein [Alphaproteobacteria bacterium SS10]